MSYDLLLEFLPWAQGFARVCAAKLSRHLDQDDLQSAGLLGYIRAADRYDVSKGTSFRGFCAVRIRGAMLDELRRWDWAPRSIHKNRRRMRCATSHLTGQLDRKPTNTELATALGIEPGEFATFQTQIQIRKLVSFDETNENLNGEESLSLAERLPNPHDLRPDQAMVSAEDRRTLLKCIGKLPKSEATVIVLHYLQNVLLRHVAAILAVTPARVSQLHCQALGRLKGSLESWRQGSKNDNPIVTI
ncbi:MAG: FliA/WhiG family RNA polymerase sigma factor [Methylacidiphilales bacterium]|nr:FliA/WhiG family RNA polymerase sigma factor [Candidatus Methylacidiphilales bacterium]